MTILPAVRQSSNAPRAQRPRVESWRSVGCITHVIFTELPCSSASSASFPIELTKLKNRSIYNHKNCHVQRFHFPSFRLQKRLIIFSLTLLVLVLLIVISPPAIHRTVHYFPSQLQYLDNRKTNKHESWHVYILIFVY